MRIRGISTSSPNALLGHGARQMLHYRKGLTKHKEAAENRVYKTSPSVIRKRQLLKKKKKKNNQQFRKFILRLKKWTCTTWQFNRGGKKKRGATSRKKKLFISPINIRRCNFQWGLCLNWLIEEFIQAWTTEAWTRKSRLQLRKGCYSCYIKSPCANQYYWLGRTPWQGIKRSASSAWPYHGRFEENRTPAPREKYAFTSSPLLAFN